MFNKDWIPDQGCNAICLDDFVVEARKLKPKALGCC